MVTDYAVHDYGLDLGWSLVAIGNLHPAWISPLKDLGSGMVYITRILHVN